MWDYESYGQLLEAGKGEQTDSPLEGPERKQLCFDLDTSDLRNGTRIHLCCFLPLSLWPFVTAALGNSYKYCRKLKMQRRGAQIKSILLKRFKSC